MPGHGWCRSRSHSEVTVVPPTGVVVSSSDWDGCSQQHIVLTGNTIMERCMYIHSITCTCISVSIHRA